MSDVRPCPICGEEIKATAIKCRFCGEDLETFKKKRDVQIEKELYISLEGYACWGAQWENILCCEQPDG